ncbi:putative lipid-transfer protein DIR1 [Ananas comosus]|uniref:Putative lipid-transfer protein DIR1 n=1 Tax=Ananas comosus TaxID=4615 RepID=A0A199W5Y7_ANACO|nr:putative lipid-transfer protein DIR1 [Ananas comosus]
MKVLLLLALVLVLVHSSPDFKSRAARAAAADDDAVLLCNMTRGGLEACKPSVRSGSSDPAADPSKECCAALAGADLPCLCSYRHSFLLPSLGIDPDLALQLPAKCNLTAPPGC